MPDTQVSIGRVKRDISELANRVAYGGHRIVLTSRGRPKAALVPMADYERLQRLQAAEELAPWSAWRAERTALAEGIAARRGRSVDANDLLAWLRPAKTVGEDADVASD